MSLKPTSKVNKTARSNERRRTKATSARSVLRCMAIDEQNNTTTFTVPWPKDAALEEHVNKRCSSEHSGMTVIRMRNGGYIVFDDNQDILGFANGGDPNGLEVSFRRGQVILRFKSLPILL